MAVKGRGRGRKKAFGRMALKVSKDTTNLDPTT